MIFSQFCRTKKGKTPCTNKGKTKVFSKGILIMNEFVEIDKQKMAERLKIVLKDLGAGDE